MIFINKNEFGAGTRGSSIGIESLKFISLNDDPSFFKHAVELSNNNNVLFDKPNQGLPAKYLEDMLSTYKENVEILKEHLNSDKTIFVSSDHSQTTSYLAAIKTKLNTQRIGVIWIDAHGDLHSPYTSPSGNMHGMTLAIATAEDNADYKKNELNEEQLNQWNSLKNIAGEKLLEFRDLCFIGLRDLEKQEITLLKNKNVKHYNADEAVKRDMAELAYETLEHLKDCDFIFVSFDVDSMDPEKVSKGTGTPVPNGFSKEQAQELINTFNKIRKSKSI